MKTRKALQALTGKKASSHSPLSEISDQLLLKARTAENKRMQEAHQRSALQSCGPLLSVLQKRLAEAQAEKLLNNSAPAIACADLHTVLKTAAANDVKDRGVARAATHAYRLWSKNPTGSLTVGDVARLRTHYQKEYPRSKIGSVIDTEVPKAGYNTLPVAQLVRIASQIQRAGGNQAAYEEACTQYGIDKNTPHAFRCRAFVRSLIEGTVPAEYEEKQASTLEERVRSRLATDSDPILGRFAQLLDDEEPMVEEEMESMTESVGETFESPITGEPLRLELEPEEEHVEEEMILEGDELPMGMEVMGQLEDFASESSFVMPDPTDPEGGELEITVTPLGEVNPTDEPEIDFDTPEDDFGFEPEARRKASIDAPGYADIIFLEGSQFDDMLEELGEERPSNEAIFEHLKEWDYGDGGGEVRTDLGAGSDDEVVDMDDYVLVVNHALGYAGLHRKLTKEECEQAGLDCEEEHDGAEEGEEREAGSEKCAEDHEHDMSCRMGSKKFSVYASVSGRRGTDPIDTFHAKGMSAALTRIASQGVRGRIIASANTLASECSIDLGNGNLLHVVASAEAEPQSASEAFAPDVNDQMPDSMPSVDTDIMIGDKTMGEQAHPFEHIAQAVLDGKTAHRSGWELKVNGDAEVELFYKGKQKRSASLGDMDEVIATFVESSRPAPKAQLKYAAFEHETGGYVIVTDLPKEDHKFNAKRILSAVQKVIPATRGTLRKDARLQLEFKAGAPELGRVRRILEDQYRIAEYRVVEAQMQPQPVDPNMQVQQPSQPGQPVDPNMPAQPGVQPAQPGVQPEQEDGMPVTVGPMGAQASWSVTFQTPEGEVQKAPVRSKSASEARKLFARFNNDCKILRVAQLEDVMPGDPLGGDEEAPIEIDEQIELEPVIEEEVLSISDGGGMPAAEQEAIHAALVHYRNQGLGPMSALDQLSSQYSDLLSTYGDKKDMDRHEIEAEVMAMVPAIWMEPAILDKAAQYDVGVNVQQPDATSVETSPGADSETDDNIPEPTKINQSQPDQMKVSEGLGSDSETQDPGSFGAPKPSAQPDQQKQKGESFADTDLGKDSESDPKLQKHFDSASASAQGADRSAKRK